MIDITFNDMRIFKFITVFYIGLFLACSCGGSKESVEPSAVVTEFYAAMTSMKFDNAVRFCAPDSLTSYIDGYKKAYEANQSKDKGATKVASEKIAATTVTILETLKDKDIRTVSFSIADGYGNQKDKMAVLKKVEGEWKIAEIKDR